MTFVKIQKNKAYSKRYQVKFRRRRLGKTDYYQRKRLTLQRKNKYNTPKWRFVVRKTNQRIICQVVYSTIKGDKVKCQADSLELKRYGIECGLTNYAASYATGLLTARRLLAVLDQDHEEQVKTFASTHKVEEGEEAKIHPYEKKISEAFDLKIEPGKDVDIAALCEEKEVEFRPFTCFLDIGLARATNGNKVFAAMKGALDGGINIPHNAKIFPGLGEEKEEKEEKDKKGKKGDKKGADKGKDKKESENKLLDRIYGKHVQNWMNEYEKREDKQEYQFSKWKKFLGKQKIEDLYKKCHEEIRKNPLPPKKEKKKLEYKRKSDNVHIVVAPSGKEFMRNRRLTNKQRKERVQEKIKKYLESRGH